ncbi:MAG: hypothetical protein FJX89_02010 [Bacteroidetes bacterium]|nr:hypothetical protein [Bacteroidota bacterium]
MEEKTQVELFTQASDVMEQFLSGDGESVFSSFTADFRFSDKAGLFKNDIHHFRDFLQHLKDSPDFQFKWKMRRYVANDIEFALYFTKKKRSKKRKDPYITIMAWMYMHPTGKSSRLSLDYVPREVIAELSQGGLHTLLNRLKYLVGVYRTPRRG